MWRVKLLLSMLPLLAESAVPEPSLAATTSPESPSPEPAPTIGLLYPFETESRDVRSLDGLWQFYRTTEPNPMQGVIDEWYKQDLEQIKPTIPMPVPASYNDINTDPLLRDHVGTVWYQRKFFLSRYWASSNQRIWLRFGSVHYTAIVWLNGEEVMRHSIGHLPFEAEITAYAKYGSENRLTVLCDNTLLNITIPQGQVHTENTDTGQSLVQTYTFDFFNYAGIQRSVHLYTTPETYIQDIQLHTDLDDTNQTGTIYYTILANGAASDGPLKLHLQLRDRANELVVSNFSSDVGDSVFSGEIVVNNANPWWPYLMHEKPGYLYTLELYLHAHDERLLDVYRMQVGIRTLAWSNESLFLNGKPLYLRGFGRHEDSDIRGKGFDLPLLLRDFSLIKWMGANAYRTSHYPYSEESMQQADREGIMIIDECSAVNIDIYGAALLANHKSAIEQLVHRDRNHASVIMWSIANEPRSANKLAADYFEQVVNFTKTLDFTRPLTAAINVEIEKDHLAQFLDVISFNRYNAWYHNSGRLDMITKNVIDEATAWHTKYNKPIVMTEYGADTMEGLHLLPSYVWSEEFQNDLLSQHFRAFDHLRLQNWFAGEFVWNFADFKTEQTYTRVGGNKKGLFTRNRQPKASAFLLRKRYYALAMELDEIKDPENVFEYYIYWAEYKESTDSDKDSHTEL